jgi:NAD(P)-dependent dehydrogenase (short-subunit alcohol dehydrogenase family)
MDTGLGGNIAMVSGASKGFGRAVAEKLAAEGVRLSLCARGAAQGGAFLDLPDQAWLDSWQLKLFGYIRVAREVFPHLVRRGGVFPASELSTCITGTTIAIDGGMTRTI